MGFLQILLATALLGSLSACAPRVPPTCWPQGARNVPQGAAQVAALADARRRNAMRPQRAVQCDLRVDAESTGEIMVVAEYAFVGDDNVCVFPMDARRYYFYRQDGAFVSEHAAP